MTSAGFTLLETVMALVLLAPMLGMLFGGLRAGIRAWDAGTGRGDRADEVLLADAFVRKELTAAFPWRFKDPLVVRLAFRGEREAVRFVSRRPAEIGGGGRAFVSLASEPARGGRGGRRGGSWMIAQGTPPDFAGAGVVDSPAVFHGDGCTFSWADGHSSKRKWLDSALIRYAASTDRSKFGTGPGIAQAPRDVFFLSKSYPSKVNP